MGFVNRDSNKINEIAKEYDSLLSFQNMVEIGEAITNDEATESLFSNVVEIATLGIHNANGLLISKEGHILTAMHCTPRIYERKILFNLRYYDVEKHCVHKRFADIAIVKTSIRTERNPVFKIYNTENLQNENIFLLTFRPYLKSIRGEIEKFSVDGSLRNLDSKGKLRGIGSYKNCFHSKLDSTQGDSGGVIVNSESKIVGIHSGSYEKNGVKFGVSSKIHDSLIMVKDYRNMLYERYLK